jgi:hypothetical protein
MGALGSSLIELIKAIIMTKNTATMKKPLKAAFSLFEDFSVIPLGFEPRTTTLKV